MYVSIHVPKTAGTSLGYMFDRSSGRRVFWDYDPTYRNAKHASPLIEKHIEFINEYYSFIHGHFYYRKYIHIIPDAHYITCVRHPVDRMVSQFLHVSNLPGDSDWRGPLIRTGKMSVVDFAQSDTNIREAHSKHLEGREIEDYDFVFITERLQKSIRGFSEKFGFTFTTGIPHMNAAHSRARGQGLTHVEIRDQERQELFRLLPKDFDLYKRAVSAFG